MDEERIQQRASNLARDLAAEGVKPNEVSKVLAYLRSDPSARAADYAGLLASQGRGLIRKEETLTYYRSLRESLHRHLDRGTSGEDERLILGWCLRLLRYFLSRGPQAEGQQRPALTAPAGGSSTPTPRRDRPPDRRPEPVTQKPSSPPAKSVPQKGATYRVQVERLEGSKVYALHPDGWGCWFEKPVLPLKVGDRAEVEVLAVAPDLARTRFRKKM